jgi:probable phosphoglycerate mutase
MNLLLVRHGESLGNVQGRIQGWSDLALTAAGLDQAEKTGAFLARYTHEAGLPVAAIYSSDLQRAWRTAQAIGRHLDLAPIAEPGLREMNFGAIEGMTGDEWKQAFPELLDAWADHSNNDFGWPGGETRSAFYQRVHTTITRLAGQHPADANLILVSHGALIGNYLGALAYGDPQHWPRFHIANCSISRVELAPGDGHPLGVACILAVPDAGHLDDLEATG